MQVYYEGDIDLSVSEILEMCSQEEKRELLEELIDEFKQHGLLSNFRGVSVSEFENAIATITANYISLSREDIDVILNIAKKY